MTSLPERSLRFELAAAYERIDELEEVLRQAEVRIQALAPMPQPGGATETVLTKIYEVLQ